MLKQKNKSMSSQESLEQVPKGKKEKAKEHVFVGMKEFLENTVEESVMED